MPKPKRAKKLCMRKKGKLIVRVQDDGDQAEPLNGVTVEASLQNGGGKILEQKTEPLFAHAWKFWKYSHLDGVAHFGRSVPLGKYTVSVSKCIHNDLWQPFGDLSSTETVEVIEGQKGINRRNPNKTLRLKCKTCCDSDIYWEYDDEDSKLNVELKKVYECITEHLGYVATAYAKQKLKELDDEKRAILLCRTIRGEGDISRAYILVQGLFGGEKHASATEDQLAALLKQMEEDATVNGWSKNATSNPKKDDLSDDNARLIVHAFTSIRPLFPDKVPQRWQGYKDPTVDVRLFQGEGETKVGVRSCIAKLENGVDNAEKYCHSSSLITKLKRATAGPIGFILNVPVWNFILISPRDANIDNVMLETWSDEKLARGQKTPKEISANVDQSSLEAIETYAPDRLVEAMAGGTAYSELGVMGGCLRGTKPEVTGIFVVVKGGNLCDDSKFGADNKYSYYSDVGKFKEKLMVKRVADSAKQHQIPIVIIPHPDDDLLPKSGVKLADLTKAGGLWHGLTKNF